MPILADKLAHLSEALGPRLAFLARWQLAPSYAAGCAAAAGMWATACGLLASSAVARLLVPLPDPQGLPGPYSIGVADFESRENGKRTFGRMLYPAAQPHTSVAHYMALPAAGLSRAFIAIASPPPLRPYLPSWVLDHWNAVTIPAHRAAPPAPLPSLPVVVFSHGLTASRETSQSLALSLAANGALVVLVEHTDRSSVRCTLPTRGIPPIDPQSERRLLSYSPAPALRSRGAGARPPPRWLVAALRRRALRPRQ